MSKGSEKSSSGNASIGLRVFYYLSMLAGTALLVALPFGGWKVIFDWMPVQGATWSGEVDFVNNFITYVAVFSTVVITMAMIYFAYKYRRRSDKDEVAYITHNATLETVWTVVPTVICIYVFWVGFDLYREMRTPPSNTVEVNVTGWQWNWGFEYSTGKKDSILVVPVNQSIKLITKAISPSPDIPAVNHSLFIPAMRVKEDVIGSEYHYMWFQPTTVGEYPIFCTEYCGVSHYAMLSKLKVVTEAEYLDYINDRGAGELTPEELGKKTYEANCKACHSIDGSRLVGPTFKGLWGLKHPVMVDGQTVEIETDENYLRESILYPAKKIVVGYPPAMVAQNLNDAEIGNVIAYIKSLK